MSPATNPEPVPARRADPRSALLWVAVALLLAAVIGVALHRAWPLLFPEISARAPLDMGCDLRTSACGVSFADGGSVQLDIRPRGMPTAEPLDVAVRLADLPPPARVELDFAGIDMDMGYNRVPLSPVPDASGVYTGTGMLPVCLVERMAWEARVLLHFEDRTLAAPFRFETRRRGEPAGPAR
ncbi:hypothetical protein [uncultured Thiohalocapsa sp.]|uniref:hypothetical protein n=1 Tax=uncultured Thiohalocapsa sp. TaxID=768990 RepID=UPI0025F573C8|nr:hypothetical protein [uncultured Thiohalocapsa sp.]